MSIKHKVAINATETFKAKINFGREDNSQGVMINVYHTDNEIFNTSKFMEKLLKKQQKLRFSGNGASHQNGAGSRARYQDSDRYGKCHIDARTHYLLILANGNGLYCMDLKLDP